MLIVVVAALCVVAGLSWLVLLEPHLTLRQRLHHLGYGGDSFHLLAAGCFLGAGAGLLVGSAHEAPVRGALAGAAVALVVWALLVAATSSLRRPAPDGVHRREVVDGG